MKEPLSKKEKNILANAIVSFTRLTMDGNNDTHDEMVHIMTDFVAMMAMSYAENETDKLTNQVRSVIDNMDQDGILDFIK